MAIIYSYPALKDPLASDDLLLISDMSKTGKPTRTISVEQLTSFATKPVVAAYGTSIAPINTQYTGLIADTTTSQVNIGLNITGMTELTAVNGSDLAIITDDPSGTPYNKKVTVDNLASYINNADGIDEFISVVAGVASLSKTLTIPTTATSIADSAFDGEAITSVVLNEGITAIGTAAFQVNNIKTLNLPSTLLTIGEDAFGANLLEGTLTIPPAVTSIGKQAFYGTTGTVGNAITGLNLSGTALTTISEEAFDRNPIAGSIVFPTSVTSIEKQAFQYNNFTAVTIPDNCVIGESAFYQITGYSKFTQQPVVALTLGTGITLSSASFRGMGYTTLTINGVANTFTYDSNTTITGAAFNQTGLTTVIIDSAITSIPNSAFAYIRNPGTNPTPGISTLTLADNTVNYNLSCFESSLATSITSLVFTGAAKVIASFAFSDNSLTAVTLPAGSTYDDGSVTGEPSFDSGVTVTVL
tara:strand:+ start:564 stop:1979 length:1416 start_codon:yes stop_codon:yes gene_type:complete